MCILMFIFTYCNPYRSFAALVSESKIETASTVTQNTIFFLYSLIPPAIGNRNIFKRENVLFLPYTWKEE